MTNDDFTTPIELARRAAVASIRLVQRVSGPMKSVADQAIRSASSLPLNLAESDGRFGRDRVHHRRIAYASAPEASTALQLLAELGTIDRQSADEALELLDRSRAAIWRMIHPKS